MRLANSVKPPAIVKMARLIVTVTSRRWRRDRKSRERTIGGSSASSGFQPLMYRPALPLVWWQRVLRAVGIPVTARRGAPVPVVFDRACVASSIYYIGGRRDVWEHAEPEA
jgi:hypothetical protein